ncbi:MAG: ribonuclease P protein component [Chloroflexota bacterium]
MKKCYRLRKQADFGRVRQEGQSWASRLLVLAAAPNDLTHSRHGFSVSRRIGGAVARNRVRRWMREAMRERLNTIVGGWDMVWIARQSIQGADFSAVERAVEQLLRRACLLKERHPSTGLSEPSCGTS